MEAIQEGRCIKFHQQQSQTQQATAHVEQAIYDINCFSQRQPIKKQRCSTETYCPTLNKRKATGP